MTLKTQDSTERTREKLSVVGCPETNESISSLSQNAVPSRARKCELSKSEATLGRPGLSLERTIALIQMSLHVVELSLDVARNLHPQLLVEVPLLLYLRCRATGGQDKVKESQRHLHQAVD